MSRDEEPLPDLGSAGRGEPAQAGRRADGLRDQILRLITEVRRPNVVVQVLPFSSGAHPRMPGSLARLEFTEPADPDLVYVDSQGGELYLERPEEVVAAAASSIIYTLPVRQLRQRGR